MIYGKNYKRAEQLLREALEKTPEDVYVLTQLANVLWNRHKDEEALCFADKAKVLSTTFCPLLNYTRGRILWSLEKYEQSMEEWNDILAMPENKVAQCGYGTKWAKSVINDARYYKADCLYHLFKDKEALPLMEEHLAMRKRGIESDFTKKEAVLFYKILKYSHPSECVKDTDVGYASEAQKKRVSKKIDELENNKDWKRLVKYLQVIISHYPMEYYLKTILSEYCQKTDDKDGCLKYASEAFAQEPYDPLVKYNYAMALMLNHFEDKALKQFEEIVDLGEDYIAYSEHGEGMRWARKLLRDTQKQMMKIKSRGND